MRIGVLSDTHSRPLPKKMLNDFQTVELIIHVGDFCALADLQKLEKIQKVEAVYGNMDDPDLKDFLPQRKIINCEGFSMGLFHGKGGPRQVLDSVREEFKKDKIHMAIFGHSHQPLNEEIDGVLYFNPGSPNDTVFAPFCSYGIIQITDTIKAKIVRV